MALFHTNSLVRIISCNLGRWLVENSLLELEHPEFDPCVFELSQLRSLDSGHGACEEIHKQAKVLKKI